MFAVGGTRLYGRYAKEGLDDRLCDGLATRHALTGQQCVLEPADSSTCFESNDASVRVSLHDAFQRLTHSYTAPGCKGVGRTAPDRRDARAGRRRIDPVHFGLIVTLNLGIGQQTPPVASVLVTACSVAKADIWEVSKVNLWFIAVLVSMLLLVTYVPVVPMALVEVFYR